MKLLGCLKIIVVVVILSFDSALFVFPILLLLLIAFLIFVSKARISS